MSLMLYALCDELDAVVSEGFRAQVTDMKGQQLARNPYMNDITRVSQSQDVRYLFSLSQK